MNFQSVHEAPEVSPGYLLWRVSTSWRSFIERILRPLGLTHPQFVILAALGWLTRKGEPTTQAAVGKMAGLDPNTTSQIIKGLEQKKLIERVLKGRAKNPLLTEEGRTLLAAALPAVETADADFFSALNPKEMAGALKLFQKLLP